MYTLNSDFFDAISICDRVDLFAGLYGRSEEERLRVEARYVAS